MVQDQLAGKLPVIVGDAGSQLLQDSIQVLFPGLYCHRLSYGLSFQEGMFVLGGIGPGVVEAVVIKRRLLQCLGVCTRGKLIGLDDALLAVEIFHLQAYRDLCGHSGD